MRLHRTLPQQHMIYMVHAEVSVYYRLGLYDFRFWLI
jgi:hypothetical protein